VEKQEAGENQDKRMKPFVEENGGEGKRKHEGEYERQKVKGKNREHDLGRK